MVPFGKDVQLSCVLMVIFAAMQSDAISSAFSRFLPSVIDRIPHAESVIKTVILGIAVLVCVRVLASSSHTQDHVYANVHAPHTDEVYEQYGVPFE